MTVLAMIFGAIGLGYGLTTLRRERIEIYSFRKREIVEYTGEAAQVVSIGLLIASAALVLTGFIGPNAWIFVVVGALVYYGSLFAAHRMN